MPSQRFGPDSYWRWATVELARQLYTRGLSAADVVSTEGLAALFTDRWNLHNGVSLRQISKNSRLGAPPDPVFMVGVTRWWLFDDMLVWFLPVLDYHGQVRVREDDLEEQRARRKTEGIPIGPVGESGFHGVSFHQVSGLWQACEVPYPADGKSSLRYWATPEEAARIVDRVRIAEGYPPINFPDEVDDLKQLPDPRAEFSPFLPHGAYSEAVAALLGEVGVFTLDGVAAWLAERYGWEPSRHALVRGVNALVRQGVVRRISTGVFGPRDWAGPPAASAPRAAGGPIRAAALVVIAETGSARRRDVATRAQDMFGWSPDLGSVSNALSGMVRAGVLRRVSGGVFTLADS
jgi:hypothetical protein